MNRQGLTKIKMPKRAWWCCGCRKYHSDDEAKYQGLAGSFCWRAYHKLPEIEKIQMMAKGEAK